MNLDIAQIFLVAQELGYTLLGSPFNHTRGTNPTHMFVMADNDLNFVKVGVSLRMRSGKDIAEVENYFACSIDGVSKYASLFGSRQFISSDMRMVCCSENQEPSKRVVGKRLTHENFYVSASNMCEILRKHAKPVSKYSVDLYANPYHVWVKSPCAD